MPAVTGLIFILIFPVACVSGDVAIVTHNTTINLTCTTSGRRTPDWYVNETAVATSGDGYRMSTSNGVDKTATLTVNGNRTSETLNVYCEVYNTTEQRFVRIHSTTLRFQDCLPSPENVHIKEHFNSSIIEWKPPYSAMNDESDIIHVDPHITQYTVYITDNYTGNIVTENVTETQYTFNNSDGACQMYHVSAWNAGGESEMSAYIPHKCPTILVTDSPDNTPTTSIGTDATTLVATVEPQQRDNIATIVSIVAGAVAIGIVILTVSVLITIWKCKRKVKVEATEKNLYIERLSQGGHSTSAEVSEVVYGTNRQCGTQISASERSPSQSSADSVNLQTPLAQPTITNNSRMQAAVSLQSTATTHTQPIQSDVVYTQVNPVKQSGSQPPADDNSHVEYTQIKHQDKL